MLISELMAAELPSEMAMTRKLLARISDDTLAWKPAGELHTIAWNATHLVETLGWVPGIIAQNEFDIAPVGCEPHITPEVTQASQLLTTFDANGRAAIDSLADVPDSVMHEPWSLKMGGQTLFTMKKGTAFESGSSATPRIIVEYSRYTSEWPGFNFLPSTRNEFQVSPIHTLANSLIGSLNGGDNVHA